MLPKLVIFDFDGTLADTQETILATDRLMEKELGLEPRSDAEYKAIIGIPLREGFRKLYPDADEPTLDEYVATYRRLYNDPARRVLPELFSGVHATLAKLQALGIRMSIASSRSRVSLVDFCRGKDLDSYFDLVYGAEDVERAKPNPDPVLKILRELEVDAEDALVVGDMPVDIAMGAAAGVRTVGVTYGNSTRGALVKQGADYIIDAFPELLSRVVFENVPE